MKCNWRLKKDVTEANYKPLDNFYGEEINNFIYSLLSVKPEERPDPKEIRNIDFISKF